MSAVPRRARILNRVFTLALLLHALPAGAQVEGRRPPSPVSEEETVEAPQTGTVIAAASWLYGVDSGSNDRSSSLLRISDDNGDAQAIGETGLVLTDVTFTPDGALYGISSNAFYRLDPLTGRSVLVGALGVSGANALDSDRTGRLFGATQSGSFFELDRNTGRARVIGSFGGGLGSSGDLLFMPDGTLYGTVPVGTIDRLVRVDPATGRATIIGSIGFRDVFGLAVSPDGRVFGSANGASTVARLIVIDTATGAGTSVGDIRPGRGMDGLATRTDAAAFTSPANLQAQVTGSSVRLTWTGVSGATSYVLEAGTFAGGSNVFVGDVGLVTSLTTVAPTGVYFIRVRARSGSALSNPSNEVQLLVGTGQCVPPGTPTLTHTLAGSLLTLLWTSVAGATAYLVEAGSAPGAANVLAVNLGATTTQQFSVGGAPPGTYFVRVRAVNACGVSTPSNEVTVDLRAR